MIVGGLWVWVVALFLGDHGAVEAVVRWWEYVLVLGSGIGRDCWRSEIPRGMKHPDGVRGGLLHSHPADSVAQNPCFIGPLFPQFGSKTPVGPWIWSGLLV